LPDGEEGLEAVDQPGVAASTRTLVPAHAATMNGEAVSEMADGP